MNRENGRASLHPPLHERHLKKEDKGGIKARAPMLYEFSFLARLYFPPKRQVLIKAMTRKKSGKQNLYIKKLIAPVYKTF